MSALLSSLVKRSNVDLPEGGSIDKETFYLCAFSKGSSLFPSSQRITSIQVGMLRKMEADAKTELPSAVLDVSVCKRENESK